jgi:hypothetical protein
MLSKIHTGEFASILILYFSCVFAPLFRTSKQSGEIDYAWQFEEEGGCLKGLCFLMFIFHFFFHFV